MLQANSTTWDPSSMIEPFTVLPNQYHPERQDHRTGEMALLWAVFIDGIQTYCQGVASHSRHSLAYREAECWIFQDSDVTTSFSTLCTLFDVDKRRLRRALLEFRERPNDTVLRTLEPEAA